MIERRTARLAACSATSLRSMSRARSTWNAFRRFWCCERSSCMLTVMPDGTCVSRIADSVLFTCWGTNEGEVGL
jgi:hypothetical protein